jgi:tetratricopeptide (TPR) repeat protein
MRYGALLLTLFVLPVLTVADEKSFEFGGSHKSRAFAYEIDVPLGSWFRWSDLEDDYQYADSGFLGIEGYGAVVMPVCWEGPRPAHLALLEVFMERFGEDYPTPFVHSETDIRKGDATGTHLVGNEPVDGEEFAYHFWIVSNDTCAYNFAAWGPAAEADTASDLQALWSRITFTDSPTVVTNAVSEKEGTANAFFLNQIGTHYFDASSYREAFRFLSQAADLDKDESNYAVNALRVLTEIDAYQEAYDWLQPRIANYDGDLVVRSWDAWLAYQTDDPDKAIRVYDELFSAGYREDDEFALYAGLLADREEWDKIEADLAEYAADGMTETLQRLQADLFTRRGRYEEALAILNDMATGRPFSADLAYSMIEVYDQMGQATEILRLADTLIEKNYRSLKSYFYKGYAEYQLKSYVNARESLTAALKYSPTNSTVQEYLDSINSILGEGENASISEPLAAVALPKSMQALVDDVAHVETIDGYGAYFINRITGYAYNGGNTLSKSHLQQIKIQDEQGVEQFSTLEFNFDPAYERFYVNSLVVRGADGVIIAEGDPAAYYVTSTVDGYEASTEKTAHLPVPSLAPGVVVEVVVTKSIGVEADQFPLDIHYLSSSRPIRYSAVYVSGKHDQLGHVSFGIDGPVERGDSLVWEQSMPVVYRWEPMQPFYDRMLPWVTIGTTSADWDQAGANYLALISDKLETERVADTARRLVRGVDDEHRKIEVISRYVQKELHYEAIEFGRRAYIPKPARESLRDRYGDCKDHAVLLYSMLNAINIPAQLALVSLNQQVLPGLPNIDQFDHMIVSVPLDGKRLYIDTTDKDLRLGRTPPRYMAGNHALVLHETSELLPIPEFSVGDSELQVEREVERTAGNELKIVEIGVFSGYQAADLRGQLREIESSEMLATMQRWVADRYSDAIVDDAFVDNVFEADSELVVELQYRLPLDNESFKLPGFFEATFLDYERLPDRRFSFELAVPFSVSTITTVRHASSAKIDIASKKPDADESRFGSWQRKIDSNEDGWVLQLEYTSGHAEYAPEEYGAFADFHRKLIGSIEQPMLIE